MFKIFFSSELKYTLKQSMVYIFFGVFTILVFAATASDNVTIGGSVGNVLRNSPYSITMFCSVLSIFGLLVATAFFNNAALRDHNNDFSEILFSTPLSKSGYYFGRFFGALLLSTVPLLGVFIGAMLGSVLAPAFGWIDGDRFGPFYLETIVNNYLLYFLPNMFIAGSIIFAAANKWKNTVVSFTCAFIILIGYIISTSLISDLDNEKLGALIDIFGINTFRIETKYFTTIEKNTISPGFNGLLLFNRIIWVVFAAIVLVISYLSFSFKEKNKRVKKQKTNKVEASMIFTDPKVQPAFYFGSEWSQFRSFFYMSFLSIVKSTTFKILFLFSAILLFTNLFSGFEYYGLQSYPITYKVIDSISNNTILFTLIILVFFSGELIWRDRGSKINEVIDATPHTSFVSLLAKSLSLVSVALILDIFFIICGVFYQLVNGYTNIELGEYLLNLFYSNLWLYLTWAGIMIMIQVLVNNKYIGYFLSILVLMIWDIMLSVFHIESNMLSIGSTPSLMYSDMNEFGPGLTGAMWFNVYWVLLAICCLLFAGSVWSRGYLGSLKNRIKASNKQVNGTYKWVMLTAFSVWIVIAGFVYYNTQILNPYKTSKQQEKLMVKYEQNYKRYAHMALPKISDVKYFIDIYPHKRDLYVKAEIKLTNTGKTSIDTLFLSFNEEWDTEVKINNVTLTKTDNELNCKFYVLNNHLLPGDTINLELNTQYVTKGFKNTVGNRSVIENGTFINNFDFLPGMGYNSDLEISDQNKRKKYGLPEKERMPSLVKDSCELHNSNYLTKNRSDFINVETVISTSSDQIAIAPGSLIKEWKEGERNFYQYKVDHPSMNFYSFMSAKYQKATRKWNDVDIEIYYDKKHSYNIDMMLDAVERSLSYYTTNFGPYFHKQCRIIEFPRYATFAQAFPGTMPYSESIGFVIDLEDEEAKNNIVDAVIAHEMAHQWWAHQVIGADMQGSTMLSESFAEYSSLMCMKSVVNDPMKMREFLKYNHNNYLRGRGMELHKELPLYKVENQGYIHYRKGSVILYALQDYIGEEKVDSAMREFLRDYRYKASPYPTSLHFLDYLEPKVPDSLKYLINDWFKEITLYDNRVIKSNYTKLDSTNYQVTMDITSTKIKADSLGNESNCKMNDWVDIGFFLDSDEKKLYHQQRVLINKDTMHFTFKLDTLPLKAAIDPRHLLIDRVYSDNIKTISEL